MLALRAKSVTSIDYSDEALSYARQYWSAENINFIKGDLLDSASYPDKKFDLIVAFEVIEHLKDDRKFLDILKDKLKPKGIIIISSPNAEILDVKDNPYHVRHYYPHEFYLLMKEFYKYVVEWTQKECGVKLGKGGDNNILVCSNSLHFLPRVYIVALHYQLYRIKKGLLKKLSVFFPKHHG
jgi:SAM-dependent methyltransferase